MTACVASAPSSSRSCSHLSILDCTSSACRLFIDATLHLLIAGQRPALCRVSNRQSHPSPASTRKRPPNGCSAGVRTRHELGRLHSTHPRRDTAAKRPPRRGGHIINGVNLG